MYAHNLDRKLDPQRNDRDSVEETTEALLTLLDSIGIWSSIWEWIFNDLSYEVLLDRIDFQYDHNLKIQYWEEFLLSITFQADLDRWKELFMLISLMEHLHILSNYRSHVTNHSDLPHTSPLPADVLPPLEGMEKIWIVSIVPHMFLHAYNDD